MNEPVCRPLMDASSPRCRCAQCTTVTLLRPEFPRIVALRLSDDQRRLAFVHQDDEGHELWIGERDPLRLRRAWRTEVGEALAVPVLSPDGEHACVPLLGPTPGLFVVSSLGEPRRVTEGSDHDPRWVGRHIAFYRVSEPHTHLLAVEHAAA